MFSKPSSKPGSRGASLSILAADCRLTGDISCDGEVHVDGRLEGDLSCHVAVIGESGEVSGKIAADLVRVLGSVTGQISARTVELGKTARITGDITHASLIVEAGAHVQGNFMRLAGEGQTPPPPAKPAEAPDKRIASIVR